MAAGALSHEVQAPPCRYSVPHCLLGRIPNTLRRTVVPFVGGHVEEKLDTWRLVAKALRA